MKFYPWPRWWLLPLLWLAFGLRLYQLDLQSIWWDEGHSIFVASHPISHIPTLPAMDVHPPAYFIVLHFWMALAGQSEFALRYLSVLPSLLAIPLLWRFARSLARVLPSAAPWSAALLASLLPLYVAYAQEVRSYALLTFLTLASTYALWLIIFHHFPAANLPVATAVFYTLLTAASLYTHYFTLFLLLFHNLAWLAWVLSPPDPLFKPKSRLMLWLVTQLGLLILFAPQLALAMRQVTSYTNPNLVPPGLAQFIGRSWQAYTVGPVTHLLLTRWGPVAIGLVLLLSYAWLIPAGSKRLLFPLFRQAGRPANHTLPVSSEWASRAGPRFAPRPPHFLPSLLFLAGWFVVPLAAYFVVLHRQASFEPRYMILVTPALLLLLALGPGWLNHRRTSANSGAGHFPSPSLSRPGPRVSPAANQQRRFTPYISAVLYAIPLLIFSLSLYHYYTDETAFKDDSAGVAAWLAAETGENDIVYVDVPHPFHYYAQRYHIPAPVRYLFVDIHTVADILTREAAGRERLYWVTWRGSDTDPRGVVPYLAQKYGQALGRQDFRGYHIEWYSLPESGTIFSVPTALPGAEAIFGDTLRLDGAVFGGSPPSGTTLQAGDSAWLALHFTLMRDTDTDYRVSVRLRDAGGQVAAQVDKDLLNDRHFRTAAWPLNDPALNQAINVYTLPVPGNTPPGFYRLEVVVYNAHPPYPSEGVTGAASLAGTAAAIGEITVTP